jgi:excisionase family DNA binding protein
VLAERRTKVLGRFRLASAGLESPVQGHCSVSLRLVPVGSSTHLWCMDTQRFAGFGLEPVLTTSELAEYLGVHVQAIYDLRTDGRGPAGIRVGREIRFRISDVLRWLDGMHELDHVGTPNSEER